MALMLPARDNCSSNIIDFPRFFGGLKHLDYSESPGPLLELMHASFIGWAAYYKEGLRSRRLLTSP
jgi:hypothetical protein